MRCSNIKPLAAALLTKIRYPIKLERLSSANNEHPILYSYLAKKFQVKMV